jgi:hypothetical protein
MTACPDHPRTLGATLGNCIACQREAAAVGEARAHELAAMVRAGIPRRVTHRHPEPAPTDLADVRDRADREAH